MWLLIPAAFWLVSTKGLAITVSAVVLAERGLLSAVAMGVAGFAVASIPMGLLALLVSVTLCGRRSRRHEQRRAVHRIQAVRYEIWEMREDARHALAHGVLGGPYMAAIGLDASATAHQGRAVDPADAGDDQQRVPVLLAAPRIRSMTVMPATRGTGCRA